MRTLAALAAIAGALAIAAPAQAAGYHRCGGGFDPGGEEGARFFRFIKAHKVGCDSAREVTSEYAATFNPRRPGSARVEDQTGRDWNCRFKLKQGRYNPYGDIKCFARGGRRVRFQGVS